MLHRAAVSRIRRAGEVCKPPVSYSRVTFKTRDRQNIILDPRKFARPRLHTIFTLPISPHDVAFIAAHLQMAPSPSTLASLALLVALIRHRDPLQNHFQALVTSFRRALNLIHVATALVTDTATDALTYLHPPRRPRPLLSRVRRFPQPATPVPRSIRRLLRLLASEDALALAHNVSSGVARGFAREMHSAQFDSSDRSRDDSLPLKIVEALSSTAGEKVVSNVVSTAVREAIRTFVHTQRCSAPQPSKPLENVIADAVLSDRGQKLVINLATSVTQTVVPIVMEQGSAKVRIPEMDVPSVSTFSPMASPLVKRPLSFSSGEMREKRQNGYVMPCASESPVTKQLLMSVMQTQGRNGIIERLALLAIRDKELVREVVRTVVSEAVKTYLTTQAELRKRSGDGDTNVHTKDRGPENVSGEGVPQSLWKVLIQSAIVDLKRALLKSGQSGSSGWLVF